MPHITQIGHIIVAVLVPLLTWMVQRNNKSMRSNTKTINEIHILVNSKMANALQEIVDLKAHISLLEQKLEKL